MGRPTPFKFLACLVVLCFERRFPKQNTVARLKSKYLPPKNFGVWLRYWVSLHANITKDGQCKHNQGRAKVSDELAGVGSESGDQENWRAKWHRTFSKNLDLVIRRCRSNGKNEIFSSKNLNTSFSGLR